MSKARTYAAMTLAVAMAAMLPHYARGASGAPAAAAGGRARLGAGPTVEGLRYHATLTVTGYTGGETLANFPMLVKFAEDMPAGFQYTQAKDDASDLRFVDANGNLLAFEIDEWNRDGESYVWVRVPEYKSGAKVTAFWGELASSTVPAAPAATDTWTAYDGVWHMNENITAADAATTASGDSTAGAHAATPTKGDAGDLTQMVSTDGAIGRARVNSSSASVTHGNRLQVSNTYPHNGVFTFSGWYFITEKGGRPCFAATKSGMTGDGWLSIIRDNNNDTGIVLFGNGGSTTARWYIPVPPNTSRPPDLSLSGGWHHLAFVYNGTKVNLYVDGRGMAGTGGITTTVDAGTLAFGADAGGVQDSLNGSYDELRLAPVARNAAWMKAEYEQGAGGHGTWGSISGPDASYSGLAGTESSATLSGRVLLANNDSRSDCPITDQDYDQTDPSAGTYWVHTGTSSAFRRFKTATTNELMHSTPLEELCGAKTIWRLDNVRIGSNYHNDSHAKVRTRNYLNVSETAEGGPVNAAAHMALRNVVGAAIYSPCYTNGIGTIYFDTVNQETPNESGYGLAVEYAIDCIDDETKIPTDENVMTVDASVSPAVTNFYENAKWRRATLLPLRSDGTGVFTALEATETFNVAMDTPQSTGGTTGRSDRFFRIVAKIDYRGPVRFRIVRADMRDGSNADGVDIIMIDNVVASYPAMRVDLNTYGEYDSAKGGHQVLGQEAAWSIPFPAVGDTDVYARGNASFSTNPGKVDADISSFVTVAKMHYRWRYLNQVTNEWRSVNLDPANGFSASKPLDLSGMGEGDLEYFYEILLSAPHYEYCDYSGLNLGLGDFYTENVSVVTNRASGNWPSVSPPLWPEYDTTYQSRGTDWFVRLRNGRSNYEAVNLQVFTIDEWGDCSPTNTVEMELVTNHVWRGLLPTRTASAGGMKFRFEALNRQEDGTTEVVTNRVFWSSPDDIATLPVSAAYVVEAGEESWTAAPFDADAGYLLFQVDDEKKTLTIVRADYQNFDSWSDANIVGGKFKGNSVENDSRSGTSANARQLSETFDTWKDMSATNQWWSEAFVAGAATLALQDYEPWESADSPNGWALGPGMLVYEKYKHQDSGRSFQMEGQGRGYISFVNAAVSPRGLESITFSGRLAQFIEFDDFAYYDAYDKMSMTNYTIVGRAAFDSQNGRSFTGNASLSLVAYYTPDLGCYEFRVEQAIGASLQANGQVFSLYRWRYDEEGTMNSTLLGSITNLSVNLPVASSGTQYIPMYLSVSNDVSGVACIMAGVKYDTSGMSSSQAMSNLSGNYFSVCYRDATEDRLTGGTYGVTTANSEGRFVRLTQFTVPVPFVNNYTTNNRIDKYTNNPITIPASDTSKYRELSSDIEDGRWRLTPGRLLKYRESMTAGYGIKARIPNQALNLYLTGAGRNTGWKLHATTNFNSFGSTTQPFSFVVRTTEDCSVKLAAGGTSRDRRTDVAVDNLVIRQWRGTDWAHVNNSQETCVPNWRSESDYDAHTNFVFTSGWIQNKSMLLSARRTTPGTPCSIRSPLFDGEFGRGIGLGMMSFAYENAQTNVNLLFQIATNNVSYNTVANLHNLDNSSWTTITNFNIGARSAADRRRGTCSCYLGLHGVKGVMRIVMDPKVVNAVSNSMDTTAFGDINITEIYCRDEPTLDDSSWWGWNLRTVGDDSNSERRMYLPDLTTSAAKTGMSLALNNSTTRDVLITATGDPTYQLHLPFVQTPLFKSKFVGEVHFKARKYDASSAQPALLTLYGSVDGDDKGVWDRLTYFVVSNATYSSYAYKIPQGHESYKAFRLTVIGVDDVSDVGMHGSLPVEDGSGNTIYGYDTPVRVLVDDMVVSEALRASVGFRNVGAFRNTKEYSALNLTTYVPGVPGEQWQPLCNESWGVQCEVEAKQLPNEVDFSKTPLVKFHWFVGETPWGYENWRDNPRAKHAWLARATDTNLIYRSSYLNARDAIVDPVTASGQVVQYMLEVIWYPMGGEGNTPVTNLLTAADWSPPAWYAPVDKNAGKDTFAAFNILDTVAPHWAWINEANIFGEYVNYENSDKDMQYVEVAVPADADISGWKVNLLQAQEGNGIVLTNQLGMFGSGSLSATKDLRWMQSNMVFRVLANKLSSPRYGGRLSYDDGTLDAVWDVDHPTSVFTRDGEISGIEPVGLQLVRASGIIEHEVVVRGYDWNKDSIIESDNPTNRVNYFNRKMPGSHFFYVGDDDGGVPNSLSVLDSRGETSNVWSRLVVKTPGRVNEGQNIDPDAIPTPNGTSIIVYCYLDGEGHILQTVGDAVQTNGNVLVFITKGSDRGTNITYTADRWYELGNVTVDGKSVAFTTNASPARTYTVSGVGKGCSNNVTVVASSKIQSDLEAAGIDPRYRRAIMHWLSNHKNAWGDDWADPDASEVKQAYFVPYSNRAASPLPTTMPLDLTTMYWLDIDPTAGGFFMIGGIAEPPGPAIVEGYMGSAAVTNVKMGIYMQITNTNVSGMYANFAKPPWVIRGMEPGYTSWDFDPVGEWGWTSATFKVTGILANGFTREGNKDSWIPQRWFVFNEDSFDKDTYISRVEVKDPLGTESPGYSAGWYDWVQEHGYSPVFFGWAIDNRLTPLGDAEIMMKTNYYNEATSSGH